MKPVHSLALTLLLSLLCTSVRAQASIKGQLQDADKTPVAFANIALYLDSNLVKVETTGDAGLFQLTDIAPNDYVLMATYLGAPDLVREITVGPGNLDLGILQMSPAAVELAEATVTATRALVEIKPDRTIFNVQGTINAVGQNGLDLLRKAPGVTIDNNDNINVLSRSGVLVYVNGKRLPLAGEELANYLRSLTAEQIDRIDIITNPGAKYEAEGNAGIIDIRLSKAENEGANGTANLTSTQGRYNRSNASVAGNYRNNKLNVFSRVGNVRSENYHLTNFDMFQNGLKLEEELYTKRNTTDYFGQFGTDFFLSKNSTIGFLASGSLQQGDNEGRDDFLISTIGGPVDSVLLAGSTGNTNRNRGEFNLNYRYAPDKGKSLNVDLDYGIFRNTDLRRQPNTYVTPDRETVLTEVVNTFNTPRDIDIYTFKVDYEQPIGKGQFGTGIKLSQIGTKNTFLFFDEQGNQQVQSDTRSNLFDYDENVYAAYLSYSGNFSEKISYNAGLRSELTDATGRLTAFRTELQEDPVEIDYLSFFPSAGLTYALNQQKGNTVSLNYGRRINRPDYNVLNPFRNQISQLSYETGNPFLRPEIVDNLELGYTLAYRYNFKLAYSKTSDQITRLIGPDDIDPRAGFIGWDNLAKKTVLSFNASLPFTVTKNWDAFVNISGSHINNQADYGENGTIDLQAFSYSFFQQQTFKLPGQLTFEVSGYFSGPGIWGGVFEYDENWALNLGLQKKFLNDQLNVKLSANDIFYKSGWIGRSEFNGQVSEGSGNWDSRNAALSLSYAFGNQQVKSRKRKTGLEDEAGRVN
ncbi:outer membrane beta-barrel protein [Neolewinella persica]|uniref:outer membrane beta-barrel protein n=1 Tax=Neolewinella persica TaxID=70998 RepID=UPI00036DD84A|nr:outer membrane beta-barrel protein [Neolewinella persica]